MARKSSPTERIPRRYQRYGEQARGREIYQSLVVGIKALASLMAFLGVDAQGCDRPCFESH